MSVFSVVFNVFLALPLIVALAQFGLLPQSLLSLYALVNHALRKKAKFAPRHKRHFNFTEVIPGLFVGTQPRVESDLNELRMKFGVTSIVSLNEEHELYIPSANRAFTKCDMKLENRAILAHKKDDPTFLRLHLPVPDYQGPNVDMLQAAVKFIDAQLNGGGKVFVHCNGGKGRSVAVVVAYMLAKAKSVDGITLEKIIEQVSERRKATSKSLSRHPWISSQSRYLKSFSELNTVLPVLTLMEKSTPVVQPQSTSYEDDEDVFYMPPPVSPISDVRRREIISQLNEDI